MTTYTNFTPTSSKAFTFQPALDGSTYTCVVTWNLFGQRYYVNLYDLDGTLVVCLPLIGSVTAQNLSSLSWSNGVVTATTTVGHGYLVGTTVALTVAGSSPSAYSGLVYALITSRTAFTYSLSTDPGINVTPGTVCSQINILAGYFTSSTMVYREDAAQFEVSP